MDTSSVGGGWPIKREMDIMQTGNVAKWKLTHTAILHTVQYILEREYMPVKQFFVRHAFENWSVCNIEEYEAGDWFLEWHERASNAHTGSGSAHEAGKRIGGINLRP